jgi:hypothetical protein
VSSAVRSDVSVAFVKLVALLAVSLFLVVTHHDPSNEGKPQFQHL